MIKALYVGAIIALAATVFAASQGYFVLEGYLLTAALLWAAYMSESRGLFDKPTVDWDNDPDDPRKGTDERPNT